MSQKEEKQKRAIIKQDNLATRFIMGRQGWNLADGVCIKEGEVSQAVSEGLERVCPRYNVSLSRDPDNALQVRLSISEMDYNCNLQPHMRSGTGFRAR